MPVSCPISSLVSVEKKTEKMVDGGTSGKTKTMLPFSEESVEELGEEDGAERIDELNNDSSADVKVVESKIVDRVEYSACRLAEWVAFLHAVVIATVVMCRVRNPACTARERPRVGALYKW